MQRLIFTFLFFISLNTINAQINKGQWLAGGNGSYTSSSQKNSSDFALLKSKSTTFDVSADGGYFILNQFCAGVRGEVNYTSDNLQEVYGSPNYIYGNPNNNSNATYTGISSITRTTIWIVGPFVRYYFLKPECKINVLADVNYLYGHSIARSNSATVVTDQNGNPLQFSNAETETPANTSSFVFEAGPAWFINPKVSLELTGGYVITRYTGGHQSNTFAVGLGIHVHLSK